MNNIPNLKNLTLSQSALSIILGSILGDGSLQIAKIIGKGYKNARFNIRHSITQEAYFMFKVNALHEISSKTNGVFLQNSSGFSSNKKYLYTSAVSPELTIIHYHTYENNKIKILRKWTNLLTPLALCI